MTSCQHKHNNIYPLFIPFKDGSFQKKNIDYIFNAPIKYPPLIHNYNLNLPSFKYLVNNCVRCEISKLNFPNCTQNTFNNNEINEINSSIPDNNWTNCYSGLNKQKNLSLRLIKDEFNSNICNILTNDTTEGNKSRFCSPERKNKKIFKCDEIIKKNISMIKNKGIKRRLRKNKEQIRKLMLFYNKKKMWNKKEIKEISYEIGLKENKVYKWLWDQKNKEYKGFKFIINK